MYYTTIENSPLGKIILAGDDIGLTGLWFKGQKSFAAFIAEKHEETEIPVFEEARRWLKSYFEGKIPSFTPKLHLVGTDFQREVWELLFEIPYGKTTTYGAIAKQLAAKHGQRVMSAQAVGGAVGRNEIPIIVPCHRVLGKNGKLVGYGGGLDNKIKLLNIEKSGIDF